MNFTKSITTIIITAILFSCESSQKQNQESTATKAPKEHQHEEAEPALSLNNGAKWAADESTFFGMQKLEVAVNNFKLTNASPAISDYNALGNSLANINKEIISQCSMKGEDHDQLHLVLHPMLGNVDIIKKGTDVNESKKNVDALSNSLGLFFKYFEIK